MELKTLNSIQMDVHSSLLHETHAKILAAMFYAPKQAIHLSYALVKLQSGSLRARPRNCSLEAQQTLPATKSILTQRARLASSGSYLDQSADTALR